MKKVFFFLICSMSMTAQVIEFTDNVFKSRLLASNTSNGIGINENGNSIKIDANNNGEIEISEAFLVYELNISTSSLNTVNDVFDLTGISNFQNLTKLLCFGNQITILDLTNLSNLNELNCNDNNLTSLLVTNLPNLHTLKSAYNELTTLDLTGLVNLESLSVHSNNISALNFEETPNLYFLNCNDNNFTELDLTILPSINSVVCSSNQMTSLIVENTSTLVDLVISNNNISSINLVGLSNLSHFDVSTNPLTSINLSSLTNLELFTANNTELSIIDCSQTSVFKLECHSNPNLTYINTRNNVSYTSDPDLLDFTFQFYNLPVLEAICMDNNEVVELNYTNYNGNGNVIVYTGDNCDIETDVPPLSISEFKNEDFVLYPNPTQNYFSITSTNLVNIIQVDLYNSLGQLVNKWTKEDAIYDLSDVSKGIYFLQIKTNEGFVNKKLIKK